MTSVSPKRRMKHVHISVRAHMKYYTTLKCVPHFVFLLPVKFLHLTQKKMLTCKSKAMNRKPHLMLSKHWREKFRIEYSPNMQ